MDVASPLVAGDKPAEAADPGEGALDDPPVAAQLLAGIDATACDAGSDPPTTAGLSATAMVVGFVGVELVRAASRPAGLATNRWDVVEQFLERHAVVGVGAGQDEGEREAVPVGDQVALGAEPASVGRVRPRLVAPLLAARDALSMQARLQSIRSAARSLRSNSRCSPSQTPASCQSLRRRQQVMPDPHPISSASISHWIPVRSTNRIPVSAARSDTRGLPPRGRGGTGGSSGSMIDQRASETRGDAMPLHESSALSVQEVLKGALRNRKFPALIACGSWPNGSGALSVLIVSL